MGGGGSKIFFRGGGNLFRGGYKKNFFRVFFLGGGAKIFFGRASGIIYIPCTHQIHLSWVPLYKSMMFVSIYCLYTYVSIHMYNVCIYNVSPYTKALFQC